jgi:hypothetical protein
MSALLGVWCGALGASGGALYLAVEWRQRFRGGYASPISKGMIRRAAQPRLFWAMTIGWGLGLILVLAGAGAMLWIALALSGS